MPIQIHDEPTVAALSAATAPEEVRAPDGRVLGKFIPAAALETYIPELDITVEEMERQRTDPNTKWYTPEEVMARLREIDKCSR
jgi:hypothetical protein